MLNASVYKLIQICTAIGHRDRRTSPTPCSAIATICRDLIWVQVICSVMLCMLILLMFGSQVTHMFNRLTFSFMFYTLMRCILRLSGWHMKGQGGWESKNERNDSSIKHHGLLLWYWDQWSWWSLHWWPLHCYCLQLTCMRS